MAKFQKGHPGGPGRPKNSENKKKIPKIEDFVRNNDIDVGRTWWETIQRITDDVKRAEAIKEFYKYVGTPPKPEKESEESEESVADILTIVNE